MTRARRLLAGTTAVLVCLGDLRAQEGVQPEFPGRADLVVVDVVVLEKGQPVRGLTRADFTVVEDGKPQPIETFEVVEVPETPAPAETAPPARPRVTASSPVPEPPGRSFVIVFDNVHLTPSQAMQAKTAVAEFVKTGLRDGDRVQLLPTAGGAWWTARMNGGQADLLAALQRLEGRRLLPTGPEQLSDHEAQRIYVYRDKRVTAEVMRRWADNGVIQEYWIPEKDSMFRDLRGAHALLHSRASEVYKDAINRQRTTTRALERVMDGLAAARGRKTVLLVSEGFVHDTQEGSFAEVVNSARRANATVYFLDARLALGGEMASAELGRVAVLAAGFTAVDRDTESPLDQQQRGATGAVSIAIDTGGDRLGTAASLADNLKRVAGESRAYYLLGYAPTSAARDGRFRRIEVRTSRPGLTVRARRGYYAPREGAAMGAPEPQAFEPDVQRALDSPLGAPGIPMRLASYVLGPAAPGKAKVLVVAEADPRQIRLEERDGRATGAVESFFLVSAVTGETYHHGSRLDLAYPPEARAQVEKTWLQAQHAFELPAGVYQVRSVVRDAGTHKTGSLIHEFEVPDPGRLRVTTPVLTDALVPGEGEPRPALLARRTFAAGGRLYGQFEVYGAQSDPQTGQPRVSAGHVLKRADGTILSELAPTPVPPNPQGQITRMLAISLRTAQQGPHELVLTVRDDVSNTQVELAESFEVKGVAPPAAAPAALPAAPALSVTQDAAGYRELVSTYTARPGDASLALARWPAGFRKSAAQAFRKEAAEPSRLLAAALLHTEAAFAMPGREKDDLETARGLLQQIKDPTARQDLTARWLVVAGTRLQNASRFDEASRFLEQALELRPKDAQAHLALGAIQELLSTLGLVAQRSETSVFGQTGQPVGSESLGKFQLYAEREKRVRVAQDHLQAALAAQPDLIEARLRLGRLAGYLGRDAEAVGQLEPVAEQGKAVELQHLAHLFLGRVHENAGRMPEAVAAYRRALELDRTSQAAALALSYALGRQGDRSGAADVLRPALRARRSSNAWIAYHLGFPSNHEAAMSALRARARPEAGP